MARRSLDGLVAPFWRYDVGMPSVQIKDVPLDVHRAAAARGEGRTGDIERLYAVIRTLGTDQPPTAMHSELATRLLAACTPGRGPRRPRPRSPGQSLQEYLLGWLTGETRTASLADVLEEVGGRRGGRFSLRDAAEAVPADRDAR